MTMQNWLILALPDSMNTFYFFLAPCRCGLMCDGEEEDFFLSRSRQVSQGIHHLVWVGMPWNTGLAVVVLHTCELRDAFNRDVEEIMTTNLSILDVQSILWRPWASKTQPYLHLPLKRAIWSFFRLWIISKQPGKLNISSKTKRDKNVVYDLKWGLQHPEIPMKGRRWA